MQYSQRLLKFFVHLQNYCQRKKIFFDNIVIFFLGELPLLNSAVLIWEDKNFFFFGKNCLQYTWFDYMYFLYFNKIKSWKKYFVWLLFGNKVKFVWLEKKNLLTGKSTFIAAGIHFCSLLFVRVVTGIIFHSMSEILIAWIQI